MKPQPESGAAIVALTSADNGESRSAIAVSLARAASKMGKKAILVDCAPTRMASRAIKAQVKTGLYDVLTGNVTLNQALAKDPRGETYVLATPKRPANTATMFASRPMQRLVSVLREGADFVVIDCGPVGAAPKPASSPGWPTPPCWCPSARPCTARWWPMRPRACKAPRRRPSAL